MKQFIYTMLAIVSISFFSCTDKKQLEKEEQEKLEQRIDSLETVNKELEEANESLQESSAALEDALKELSNENDE